MRTETNQPTKPTLELTIASEPVERGQVLQQLSAVWREAWSKLGLSNAATIVEVARRLDIDRGTSQRLNRIARMAGVEASDIGQFPGIRAWNRVLIGVKNVLGAEDPSYLKLSSACDRFAKWLDDLGGSRSSAMRQMSGAVSNIDSTPEAEGDNATTGSSGQDTRALWVDAAVASFGYSVDVRMDLQMARESSGSSPALLDLISIHILKGCRGNLGALPLSFSRVAYSGDRKEIQASKEGNVRSFHVLKSFTSQPAPVLLTTIDAQRQTIFVEPQWTSMRQPLDLALMHEEREALTSPWGTGSESLETATVNRHPNRKLILERYVTRYVDSRCTASLRAFRTQMMLTQREPWFDRIPENVPVQRVGTVADALATEVFEGYSNAVTEAMSHLEWDWDDLVVYRAEIINPMPLATYTVKFDTVRS